MPSTKTPRAAISADQQVQFQDLVETSQDLIALCDPEGRYTYLNPAWESTFGYRVEEMLGRKFSDFQSPETIECDLREFARLMRCGTLKGYETVCIGKSGHRIQLIVNAKCLRDRDGQVTSTSCTAHDITERRRAEKALRQSEERFRKIIEKAPLAMAVVSMDGVIEFINQKAINVFGYLPEDIPTMARWWVQAYPDETYRTEVVDVWMALVNKAIAQDQEILGREYSVTCKDGAIKTVFISGVPVADKIFVLFDDITERKRAENLLALQHTLALGLNTTPRTEAWLELCLDAVISASGMDSGGIYLGSDNGNSLRLAVHQGLSAAFVASASQFDTNSPSGRLVLAGQPVYSKHQHLPVSVGDSRPSEDLRAVAVIPLTYEGSVIGCVNLGSHTLDDVPAFARTALETIATQIGSGVARLRTAEALRQSNEKFAKIFETSPDSITISRLADGTYLEANQSFTRISGYAPKEALYHSPLSSGISLWTIEEDRDRMVDELLTHGEMLGLETPLRMKDGRIRTALLSSRLVEINGEQCVMTVARDITERKQAEESLAAEKELLAVTLRSIGDGVITTDTNGCVVIMNKVAEDLTGWEWSEARGKPLDAVFGIINENTRQACDNPVAKVLSTGSVIELANHTLLVTRNGAERIIADSGAPIKDRDGKTIGVVLVFRDMTEKQKIMDIIQRTAKLDSLGVLAGGIAHDFNNLLSGIFGYIDLARSVSKDALAIEYLEATLATMNRARALTLQLLTFSDGGAPIQKVTPLVPFIQETVRFALSGSNAACQFSLPDNLWPCNIDRNQISQVIDNIVINAQQAMPSGGTVHVTAENVSIGSEEYPSLAEGNYVKVSIKDNGVGIPKDIMLRIFDPFYTTKTKGHGLGLATCHSIINRHGGCIIAESGLGKGSAFHVYLPAATQAAVANEAVVPEHKGSGTIIVVDDEEAVRFTLQKILELLGYSVVCKSDGHEAIACYASETEANRKFAAMIFDLTIPGGMGGVEAAAEIRKLNPDIPIFVVSGYADDSVMRNPVDYGFTASLCKPFTIAEVSGMLGGNLKE